jgi:hypothetical protein
LNIDAGQLQGAVGDEQQDDEDDPALDELDKALLDLPRKRTGTLTQPKQASGAGAARASSSSSSSVDPPAPVPRAVPNRAGQASIRNQRTVQFSVFTIAWRPDIGQYIAKCPLHTNSKGRCWRHVTVGEDADDVTHDRVLKQLKLWLAEG